MRKKRIPKPISLDPVSLAVIGVDRAANNRDKMLNCLIGVHAAMLNLTQGRAEKRDISKIVEALNIAEGLTDIGVMPELLKTIRSGQDGLISAASRGLKNGRFVLRADEMNSINEAISCHDQQLETCTVGQLDRAIARVQNVIRSGGARKIEEAA